jgi:hypothetical protein
VVVDNLSSPPSPSSASLFWQFSKVAGRVTVARNKMNTRATWTCDRAPRRTNRVLIVVDMKGVGLWQGRSRRQELRGIGETRGNATGVSGLVKRKPWLK